MTSTDQERWLRVREKIRAEVGDLIFDSWFERMDLDKVTNSAGEDGKSHKVHMTVPTPFLKSWIGDRYMGRVLACWQGEDPTVVEVTLGTRTPVLCTAMSKPKPPELPESLRDPRTARLDSGEPRVTYARVSTGHDALGGSPLDLRYTFDGFVVGRSNTLAHAAVKQVAVARRGERIMFNPLYIHAGVGLGKSHLLQALTWAGNKGAERKVLYLTAEKFVYGFVSALRTQTALAFKEALRGIDVLVIDDLQFLHGKSMQAEFCHTINALIDAGRQVVIAADRAPTDLEALDDRVRSRLSGGLVVEIGPHGEDHRLEILKARVTAARQFHPGFTVPDQVLRYVATSVTHNGRDLEAAINRLLAHNKLTGQPVTMELAEREVRDLIRPKEARRVKIEDIQRVVARQYNVSRGDMLSQRRTANVVRPRQVAIYLAKTLTLRSLPEIGRRFGGRDHTTILHSVRKIERLVGEDTLLADEIEVLKRLLQQE